MRLQRSPRLFPVVLVFAGLVLLAAGPGQAQARKAAAPAATAPAFDFAAAVKSLKVRNIGPANMGGRTVDFAVPENDVSTIYAAVGPSGLWKTEDAGLNWSPSFHREATVSVGAVAVSASHPDIVWLGTGEATARNSVAPGDGVYKSEDAGKTWRNMGLAETRFISRIVIDPADPDVVYVAAQGHLWGPNEERGVYRTADGGKTWAKVLYVNPETGACDLAIDPSNSRILYAGMWEHRRWPYFFRSGGPGSGLYRTTDGGETWTPAKDGLPAGPYGRIGLGVSRSNPGVVYALIEAEGDRRGLFRSEDKGRTWRRASDRATYDQVNFRPFYYSRLTVDPTNDLVVYVYSGSCYVSRDAGKTFAQVFMGAHPDHHAVWVDPHNPKHVISGNDGGIDISWDGGRKALGVAVAPWAEVYNVGLDMRDPYYINVGLQDNGNWLGPSNTRERAGIFNSQWVPTGGGDGYYAQFDPVEWWILYRDLQMGGIERHNLKTGESVRIRPEAPLAEPPYRFNWNAPIYLSPHDRNVLYFGGNFLFKSTDRGSSWTKASPDLTTNDPAKLKDSGGLTVDNTGAENHCTILTIDESPLKPGVLWVGTDDGQVQVSRDGGASWTNVTSAIKGFGPGDNWVTRIEASHHLEGGVYLTVSRHQVDDYRPYIFKSEDFGRTWTSLRGDLPAYGYLHTVRESPLNRDLLFVGSEFGLFVSGDGGRRWVPLKGEFPTVAVRDVQIHPREHDLVIGTHGRGVWIIDDIRPLERLTAEAARAEALLFDVKDAPLFSYRTTVDNYSDAGYAGTNSPFGAAISYYLDPAALGGAKLKLSVLDKDGREVAAPFMTREPGLNRVYWNLRGGAATVPTEPAPEGRGRGRAMAGLASYVLPGEYKAVLEAGDKRLEAPFKVLADPDQGLTDADRLAGQAYARESQELARSGRDLLQKIESMTKQLDDVASRVASLKPADPDLAAKVRAVRDKVAAVKGEFFLSPADQGFYRKPLFVAFRGGTAAELVTGAGRGAAGMGAPTRTMVDQLADLKAFTEPLIRKMAEVAEKDVPELNKALAAKGVPYIK